MASQKLTNCCVAAIALVTAAYLSTPHSSTIARLAFGAFCLAIHFLLSCENPIYRIFILDKKSIPGKTVFQPVLSFIDMAPGGSNL
jgi:hypothetical protein